MMINVQQILLSLSAYLEYDVLSYGDFNFKELQILNYIQRLE